MYESFVTSGEALNYFRVLDIRVCEEILIVVARSEERSRVAGELGQAVADGKGRSGSAVLTVRLVEDMGEVMRDGFLAQP